MTLTLNGSVVVVVEAIEVDVLGDGRFLIVVEVVELLALFAAMRRRWLSAESAPRRRRPAKLRSCQNGNDRAEDSQKHLDPCPQCLVPRSCGHFPVLVSTQSGEMEQAGLECLSPVGKTSAFLNGRSLMKVFRGCGPLSGTPTVWMGSSAPNGSQSTGYYYRDVSLTQ